MESSSTVGSNTDTAIVKKILIAHKKKLCSTSTILYLSRLSATISPGYILVRVSKSTELQSKMILKAIKHAEILRHQEFQFL